MAGKSVGDIIREIDAMQGRLDADNLPSPEEFAELSRMFQVAALSGGAQLTMGQCRMLEKTFRTLSVSIIATENVDG